MTIDKSESPQDAKQIGERLRNFALSLPGTAEEFPWGESVIKVNGKIFVFLGLTDTPNEGRSLGLKLPESGNDALNLPFAKPMGYNMGKHGWIDFRFPPGEILPADLLEHWVLESYRAIAPKKLVAQLQKQTAD